MKKTLLLVTVFSLTFLVGCNGSSSSRQPTAFTVSGTISGLASQSSMATLTLNTIQTTTSTNGNFAFQTYLASGASYIVTVTPPSGIACAIENGTGVIDNANVTNVAVLCQATQPVVMACGTETNIGSDNVAPLVVDGFPCANGGTAQVSNTLNQPYTSMKICAPGSTTNCQVIDHVIVDSGSTGIRVAASVLQSSLQPGAGLPAVPGSVTSTSLTECEAYVSSFVYGPMVTADIYIAGKVATGIDIQVFGGSTYGVPTACSSQGGTSTNTTQSFGGNGLVGVNFDALDQGAFFDCQNAALGSCTTNLAYAGVPNLIEAFSADNNGVVLSLPAIGNLGSLVPVVGALIFGVNTQSNNVPAASTIAVTNDPTFGTFATSVGGTWYTAYIDSGTAVNFFNDSANSNLVACPGTGNFQELYCPTADQSVTFGVANTGTTATIGTVTYPVTNASDPDIPNADVAISNFAGPINSSSTTGNTTIAYGLTSFFGHTNYFLFSGKTAPGTNLGGTSSTTVTGPINGIQ